MTQAQNMILYLLFIIVISTRGVSMQYMTLSINHYDLKELRNNSCSVIDLPPKPDCNPPSEEFETPQAIVMNLWKSATKINSQKGVLLTTFNVTTSCTRTFWGNTIKSLESSEVITPVSRIAWDIKILMSELEKLSSKEFPDDPRYECKWNDQIYKSTIVTRAELVELNYKVDGTILNPGFNCSVSGTSECEDKMGRVLLYRPVLDLMTCPYEIVFQTVGVIQAVKGRSQLLILAPQKKLMFWFSGKNETDLIPWCIDVRKAQTIYKDESGYLLSWSRTSSTSRAKRSVMSIDSNILRLPIVRDYQSELWEALTSQRRRSKRQVERGHFFSSGVTELQRDWSTSQLQWSMQAMIKEIRTDMRAITHQLCLDNLRRWTNIWRHQDIDYDSLASFLSDEPGSHIRLNYPVSGKLSLCIPRVMTTDIKVVYPPKWKSGCLEVQKDGEIGYLNPGTGLVTNSVRTSKEFMYEEFLVPLKGGCSVNLINLEKRCGHSSLKSSLSIDPFLMELKPLYSPDELRKLSEISIGSTFNIPQSGPYASLDSSSILSVPMTWVSFMHPISQWFSELSPNLYWLLAIILFSLTIVKVLVLWSHHKLKPLLRKNKDEDDESDKPQYRRHKVRLL